MVDIGGGRVAFGHVRTSRAHPIHPNAGPPIVFSCVVWEVAFKNTRLSNSMQHAFNGAQIDQPAAGTWAADEVCGGRTGTPGACEVPGASLTPSTDDAGGAFHGRAAAAFANGVPTFFIEGEPDESHPQDAEALAGTASLDESRTAASPCPPMPALQLPAQVVAVTAPVPLCSK